MSVVLVGGHDRMQREYKEIAKQKGFKIKVYTHIVPSIEKCMGCPKAVIIFTATASHKLVKKAVCLAKKQNVPCLRAHNSSANSLNNVLDKLNSII